MPNEESLSVDQLKVDRHIKLKSSIGKIDVHCSDTVCGAWLTAGNTSASVYVERDGGATIALYPKSGGVPFAISKHGIQLPTDSYSERPLILSWNDLKRIAAAFKSQ